jgi:hypothetical protein
MSKSTKAAKDGPTKAERKALKEREAALLAELQARTVTKPAKPGKKVKAAPSESDIKSGAVGVDISGLKPKALKALIADKTNGKTLRKAAKAELAARKSDPHAAELEKAAKAAKAEAAAKPVKPAKRGTGTAAPTSPEPVDDAGEPGGIDYSTATDDELATIITNADDVLAAPGTTAGVVRKVTKVRDRVLAEVARRQAAKVTEAVDNSTDPTGADNPAGDTDPDAEIKARVQAKRAARAKSGDVPVALDAPDSARNDDALPGESEVDYQWRKAGEAKAEQTAEEVETERGRVFAVGEQVDAGEPPAEPISAHPADDRGFAIPSEAALVDFEVNGNGQYKVKRPGDGKYVGYTRVTTFIGTNEDRTLIEKWKARILLEGVAINDTPDERGTLPSDPVVAQVRDLIHRRDLAIAKARKADRKGKLVPGQYGTLVDAAWSDFRKSLDALGESLLELGGAHEKAAKGTQLHELFELYDREGIDAVGELVLRGEITNADLADVEAYGRALEAAGIKVLPEYIECPVVIHEEKIAGRLDRIVMARMPGSGRAAKYVLDVKSGRIDLGAGKIAQQLEKYSKGTPYNLETGETLAPHGASRTKALVLHITPGSGEARIHPVDLSIGRVGNDLSAKVRAFRNDGKRAIDTTADLAKPEATV